MSSTTSQPASTRTQGECVVCGKICSTRCSSCSQHGLDWMCFCSVEHQRLIWFAHKRTCGANSNPFLWPLLNEEEMQECRNLRNLEYKNTSGELVTWERHLLRSGLTVEQLIQSVSEGNKFLWSRAECTPALLRCRNLVFSHKYQQMQQEPSNLTSPVLWVLESKARLAQDPYGLLAFYLEFAWPKLKESGDKGYEWYTIDSPFFSL